LKPCFFAPKDWIYREGELGLVMYFLQIGQVEMVTSVSSHIVVLDVLSSGAYFGEVAVLLDGLRREASARAVSFCTMFSFTKQALSQLLAMYPAMSRTMQQEMESRLRRWRLKRVFRSVSKLKKATNIFATVMRNEKSKGRESCTSMAPSSSDEPKRSAVPLQDSNPKPEQTPIPFSTSRPISARLVDGSIFVTVVRRLQCLLFGGTPPRIDVNRPSVQEASRDLPGEEQSQVPSDANGIDAAIRVHEKERRDKALQDMPNSSRFNPVSIVPNRSPSLPRSKSDPLAFHNALISSAYPGNSPKR